MTKRILFNNSPSLSLYVIITIFSIGILILPISTIPAYTTPLQSADTSESQLNQTETTAISDVESTDQTSNEGSGAETDEIPSETEMQIAEIRELISFGKVFNSILILFISYFFNKYLTIILENLAEKATNYRLLIKRVSPISRIFIWSMAIYIIIAGIIVPPFETIITIAASVGLAIGFASQDILKNIFGGFMIILDRPFQVGDKIQVGEHYGEVMNIGLRSSRIITPDDSMVSIPNGELMNQPVSNSNSSALDCQVVAEIFLPATTNAAKVKDIAKRAVYSSYFSYLNKPVVVIVLNEIHDKKFVMKLKVKAYVVDIRYEFIFKSEITELILKECNKQKLIPEEAL
ncbi:mechanosensitive ion channel family protein [Rhodohalobacter sulfatireducens]|uniref:Mechanosensitive ion channel family protein n=1 Tax=Rhodohalobacter sulfatireducens TaxID=2911366 RepID=A0ABS9KJ57_9BACT|nr:mechanosensitive ion channel family protein [Rhodohalobacter sulfatireducens]MCG2590889.1 mechanosensitive ion channel family protein [Rhodohalobacter sulfatireducens]